MQAKLPVLAATDPNTDIGEVIVNGGFGWWCKSNSVEDFDNSVGEAINADTRKLGEIAYQYLQDKQLTDKYWGNTQHEWYSLITDYLAKIEIIHVGSTTLAAESQTD